MNNRFKHLNKIMVVGNQKPMHIFMNMIPFPAGENNIARNECQATTDQRRYNSLLCNRHRILAHKAESNDQVRRHKHHTDDVIDANKTVGKYHKNQQKYKPGSRIMDPYEQ